MEKILPTNVEERKQLFNYGLFILFYNLFTFVIVLLIGRLLGEIKFIILLMTLYIPVRIIIGGYHCKRVTTCLMMFSLIIAITIIFYKINLKNLLFYLNISISILSIYYILKNERNKIKNIALMIFIVEIIISFLNNIIGDASFYSVMLISTFYIIDLIVRKYNSRKLKIRNKVSLY
ncbi:MAG: accessory gene regulator B family protein [Faecalibacillus intestinalis]|uniref:accessory gene regulator B family protein n=2 Tax=Faecalibacillus intestinalis TaxID=1982626 RepID=UPI000E4B0535|nr:hypothetical protein DWZ30_14510 [Coprobacillus sp. AF31-1BH]RHR85667.1 hypothetical protein DWW38_12530 [Coprobacillus sp. AF15-30]RHT53192.1 hypothetical protein DW760_04830 [Coprobacillus sp. AM29-13]